MAGALLAAAISPALAQPTEPTPDWPCIQRLVPEIAPGMVWSGPPLPAANNAWEDDPETAALAHELARRATPLEQAEAAVADSAAELAPAEREQELTLLFQGTLALINAERARTIAAIERYARGQRRLAEKIAADNRRLEGYRVDLASGAQPELEALREERDWDLRVFDDRQQLLRQICDQPVRLEQRAFTLARIIQNHLPAP